MKRKLEDKIEDMFKRKFEKKIEDIYNDKIQYKTKEKFVEKMMDTVKSKIFDCDILPIFGLAQHYGLPTKFLDWSFDPFVAAFFAASSGIRKTKNPEDGKIAVWKLTYNPFKEKAEKIYSIVHVPYAGNPNLAAQQGVFTRMNEDHEIMPLNDCFDNDLIGPGHTLYKYTLPITECPNLLLELQSRGYDAGRIFPGYGGIAKAIKDSAYIASLKRSDI